MEETYAAGRRAGLGVAALLVGLVSFVSILGAEKAILAIVLGALAVRGSSPGTLARRLGTGAIGLGVLFLVVAATLLALYWNELAALVRQLDRLS
jgi:hypothetical protein